MTTETTTPAPRAWQPGEDAITEMTSLAAALDEIVTKENALARENRLSAIGEMEAEKTRLSIEYHRYARALKADPDRLRHASEAEKARFKAAVTSLEGKLADNERLLGAAKSVVEGIVQAAARAATEARAPTIGYTKEAGMSQRPKSATATIALDQRV